MPGSESATHIHIAAHFSDTGIKWAAVGLDTEDQVNPDQGNQSLLFLIRQETKQVRIRTGVAQHFWTSKIQTVPTQPLFSLVWLVLI